MFDQPPFPPPAFAWAADATFEREPAFARHMRAHHGPRLAQQFWAMFGPRGPRGPQMFGRGDLKYVLLDLIKERPKHGYEMIKELEQRAGGFYTPSAGAVYPTLQLLEDRGWVTSETLDGKKVYSITDDGRQALRDRGPRQGPFERPDHEHEHEHERHHSHGPRGGFGPRGPFGHPELHALGAQSVEVARLMRDAVLHSQGDPAKLEQLSAIVAQTRLALEAFLRDEPPGDVTPTGPAQTV